MARWKSFWPPYELAYFSKSWNDAPALLGDFSHPRENAQATALVHTPGSAVERIKVANGLCFIHAPRHHVSTPWLLIMSCLVFFFYIYLYYFSVHSILILQKCHQATLSHLFYLTILILNCPKSKDIFLLYFQIGIKCVIKLNLLNTFKFPYTYYKYNFPQKQNIIKWINSIKLINFLNSDKNYLPTPELR